MIWATLITVAGVFIIGVLMFENGRRNGYSAGYIDGKEDTEKEIEEYFRLIYRNNEEWK